MFRILTTTHDHRKSRNTSNAPKTPKFNQTKQHPRIINQIKRGSITKMRSPLTNSASQALTDHRRPVTLAQSSSIMCMVRDCRATASLTSNVSPSELFRVIFFVEGMEGVRERLVERRIGSRRKPDNRWGFGRGE